MDSNVQIQMTAREILAGRPLSLTEAASKMPLGQSRKALSLPTLLRYVRDGRHGIRLPAVAVGNGFVTSEEALEKWLEATTALSLRHPGTKGGKRSPAGGRPRKKPVQAVTSSTSS